MFKILSIDGGGIRGVIPGVLLHHLETRTGKPIAELFDLIAGTSTGGILAAGLATPDALGRPRFSAAAMLDLYVNRGKEIFQRSFWRGVASISGIADERYPHGPLELILNEYLQDARLSDCVVPILVSSYEIERREPYFFKSRHAKLQEDRNHLLRELARATSAAPTFFEPANVGSFAPRPTRRILVDGGVFANNPAMCAYAEARSMGAEPAEILVVSLGTGVATRKIPYEDARGWGAIGWIQPIISVMMDGVADSTDYQLRHLLPHAAGSDAQRYFRFNTELNFALDDMDAASAGNIRNLQLEAGQILENQAGEMDRLIDLLTGGAKPTAPAV